MSLNAELVSKFNAQAQSATSLLWVWGAMGAGRGGTHDGKFALFEGTLAQFSFVVNGGAGVGGTRHQLQGERKQVRPDGEVTLPPTYGDTGVRFMGSLGAGFRLRVGEHFAFRLEVRDVVYTARMETINGCNTKDLDQPEKS